MGTLQSELIAKGLVLQNTEPEKASAPPAAAQPEPPAQYLSLPEGMRIFFFSLNGEKRRKGDVLFLANTDAAGRKNQAGGHTNFGYSGYLVIKVFDGRRWCWLDQDSKDKLSTEEQRRYEARKYLQKVMIGLYNRFATYAAQHGWHPTFAQKDGRDGGKYWAAFLP